MKKFERLPAEKRKEEIMQAALSLFTEKGFADTTMENIIEKVTLSKGGVYRLYASTTDILSDIILNGMHARNDFYMQKAKERLNEGKELTPDFLAEIMTGSLFIEEKTSSVYVEFLWEKRRNEKLRCLYEEICKKTVAETSELIKKCGADRLISIDGDKFRELEEILNSAILSLKVLGTDKDKEKVTAKIEKEILSCIKEE